MSIAREAQLDGTITSSPASVSIVTCTGASRATAAQRHRVREKVVDRADRAPTRKVGAPRGSAASRRRHAASEASSVAVPFGQRSRSCATGGKQTKAGGGEGEPESDPESDTDTDTDTDPEPDPESESDTEGEGEGATEVASGGDGASEVEGRHAAAASAVASQTRETTARVSAR